MRKIAVMDLETDPFSFGVIPQPFVAGFYDGTRYITFWSDDCVNKFVEFLANESEPLIIYAHNGGRFDFFYFLSYLHNSDLRIINSRIIQAHLGEHELRDSYAILPFPLSEYRKDEIDYEKFRRNQREHFQDEILSYLRGDCIYLYELVTQFTAEFGDVLTVGSAAMKQIKARHKFSCGNETFDERFRTQYYFGGRVQVFKPGITYQPCRIFDVNSMYPYVMQSFLHPVGTNIQVESKVTTNTCFIDVTGKNYGAFPVRQKDHSLSFTREEGRFQTTIHEWQAALDTGTFKPAHIHKTLGFTNRSTFAEFVQHFYAERKSAKIAGDAAHVLFYKFILNAGYGKFAQNPAHFSDWRITGMETLPEPWTPAYIHEDTYIIWQRPTEHHYWYNIAIGASITGAARAMLLRGLHAAVSPIYCDTDSIMCESLIGCRLSNTELGAWKLEGEGTMAAIAGKKLYAVFNAAGACIKKAHKGAHLTPQEILRIARGATIQYQNPVPAFKLDGHHQFTTRNLRRNV